MVENATLCLRVEGKKKKGRKHRVRLVWAQGGRKGKNGVKGKNWKERNGTYPRNCPGEKKAIAGTRNLWGGGGESDESKGGGEKFFHFF